MKKIFLVLIVIAVLMGAKNMLKNGGSVLPSSGGVELVNPYPPSSPLYADHQAFVDKFNSNAKLKARYSGDLTSKGLYAAWDQAFSRGARSFPRERLIEMAKTQAAILPRLPEASCAKLAVPQDDFDQALGKDIQDAIERLPARHHRIVTDTFYDALLAEIDNAPAIPVDEEALKGAFIDLAQSYPGEYGERLMRVFSNPAAASPEDACWAVNSLITTSAQLSPSHSEALLRKAFGG
ncbi:hypothetical protein [Arenimonas oryziterrae]|uniref:Uncharacterized protein n=1 Tax=Arenimonas oryziterrae DSM 21050 = YC6267 TaxID=1121015 RepID=A0A091BK59_9GAMM|nr:hypothetical protein [Arenimonas oryziterrae]KFN44710.1 hypothetical protein N789_01475 [Arenimonas oryziterrae DSM 21050 = YC6267]